MNQDMTQEFSESNFALHMRDHPYLAPCLSQSSSPPSPILLIDKSADRKRIAYISQFFDCCFVASRVVSSPVSV